MVAQVGAAARAYGALTMASLRSSVQRPATLVVRGIGSALVALCEAVGVVLLVDRFGSIAGWRTPEIIVLAGLVFTGQGLAQAVGNRLRPDDVSLMIRRGTFDQVLMKPVGGYLSRRTFHTGSWWKLGQTWMAAVVLFPRHRRPVPGDTRPEHDLLVAIVSPEEMEDTVLIRAGVPVLALDTVCVVARSDHPARTDLPRGMLG